MVVSSMFAVAFRSYSLLRLARSPSVSANVCVLRQSFNAHMHLYKRLPFIAYDREYKIVEPLSRQVKVVHRGFERACNQ